MTAHDLSAEPGPPAPAPPQQVGPPPPTASGSDRRRVGPLRTRLRRLDVTATPYLIISPFFVLFAVFGIFPIVYTLWVSLHKYDLVSPNRPFIGLDNYRRLLEDEYFWNALRNTVAIFTIATVPQLLLALMLAALLNRRLRARTFFRMGVLLPNITSIAAVTIIFNQLFGRDYGLFNWLLGLVGIGPIDWKADQLASWVAIATMVDWRWTGYNALIFLAAMQTIPKEIYEAAAIDGAGPWRSFWRITVPLMKPTLIFVVIISTIGGMQLFAEPLLFDDNPASAFGGAGREFQTLALYVYEVAFRNLKFGYAATITWVMFLIVVLVTLVNLAVTRRIGGRE